MPASGLRGYPQLRQAWYVYLRERALDWLADNHIQPAAHGAML